MAQHGPNVFLARSTRHLLGSDWRILQQFKELFSSLTSGSLLRNQSCSAVLVHYWALLPAPASSSAVPPCRDA